MKSLALLLLAATTALTTQAQSFTPTRFTVTVEGKPDSSGVLLLPGLTSGREVFDHEAALLAPAHRLYRVQLDGFAGQPAGPNATGPLLAPVVEQLHEYIVANHLHPYVIGHSLGGLLGLMLAAAHPEDVRKLLVVDSLPFYALVFSPQATVEIVRPQAEAMRTGLLAQTPEQTAAGATQTSRMLVNNPEGQKLVASESIASDHTVMANAMYEDLTTDLRPALAGIKTPTVLLYPYDPAVAGPDPSKIDHIYQSAYASMPNITLHRIENSRHFIQLDQPVEFHQQVQDFLK